jgi:hypothetical protein
MTIDYGGISPGMVATLHHRGASKGYVFSASSTTGRHRRSVNAPPSEPADAAASADGPTGCG